LKPLDGRPWPLDLQALRRPPARYHRRRRLLAIGVAAPLLALAVAAAAIAAYPGFDNATQYLSELGERGSVTGFLMNYGGIIPTGAMIALFGLGLVIQFRRDSLAVIAGLLIVIHGLLRITAGLFPCDTGCVPEIPSFSQQVHNLSATIGYIALTTAAFVMGAAFIVRRLGALPVVMSYGAAVVASVALVMLEVRAQGQAGLYQRIALIALQTWLAGLALYLLPNGSPALRKNI
jgi:hypothetical membrane protein